MAKNFLNVVVEVVLDTGVGLTMGAVGAVIIGLGSTFVGTTWGVSITEVGGVTGCVGNSCVGNSVFGVLTASISAKALSISV